MFLFLSFWGEGVKKGFAFLYIRDGRRAKGGMDGVLWTAMDGMGWDGIGG